MSTKNLKDIYEYKKIIMPKLFNSTTIVSTIDNKNIISPDELINKNLFPMLYTPNIETEPSTYICFDLFVPRIQDKILKDVNLHFYIFSHQDHLWAKYGYSRVDYLQSEVDKIFNGSMDFGIDGIKLKSSLPLYLNTTHRGKELIYKITNFNQGRMHNV